MPLMEYAGKTVAVTGASGGIGAALAEALEGEGATVARISRTNLAAGLTPETWTPAAYQIVILNAGYGMLYPANKSLSGSAFRDMMDVNCLRTIEDAHAALAGGAVHVHLVSSIIGVVSSPLYSLYAASKYALRGWAYGAARELPGRVSISYPNGTATNYFRNLKGDDALLEMYATQVEAAQGSYDTPEAVARGILDGIRYGAREIIPTPFALQWFDRNEENISRMWHPGLTQPSVETYPWWEEVGKQWATVGAKEV